MLTDCADDADILPFIKKTIRQLSALSALISDKNFLLCAFSADSVIKNDYA